MPTSRRSASSSRAASSSRVAHLEPPRHLSRAELRALGRARRGQAPRRGFAEWEPPPRRRDPVRTLAASNRSRLPDIAPIRIGRMMTDPFAFLRGSAGVMADDLAHTPASGITVQASGDMHLLNLGVFGTPERNLVFDVNDFDETLPGPWEWDLKRLVASFVVTARTTGLGDDAGRAAARAAAEAYRIRLGELAELTSVERRYLHVTPDDVTQTILQYGALGDKQRKKLLKRSGKVQRKARSKTSFQALDRYTDLVDGRRVIVPDPPLVQPLEDDAYVRRVHRFFDRYVTSLPDHVRRLLDDYRYVDAALKVVGVGSVGTRAFMVLLASEAGEDPLFLQIKEAQPSVLSPHVGASAYPNQGQRVVEGQRLLQSATDLFLGWGSVNRRDFYVRQLRDMKGSADPTRMKVPALEAYGTLCGGTVAQAHARTIEPEILVGYLGRTARLDDAAVTFAAAYADQTERDHEALVDAVRAGRIEAIEGV